MNLNQSATPNATSLLEIVMSALEATWRIPDEAPRTGFPSGFHRDALRAFTIDRVKGGYVANIEFDVAPGEPNTIGTPDARPLPTHKDAFLAGAVIVCQIVTGSPELPFFVLGDEIVIANVTSRGTPFLMRRPLPTHCA